MIGATSLVRRARYKPEAADPYRLALLARKPARVASVAMANKMARVHNMRFGTAAVSNFIAVLQALMCVRNSKSCPVAHSPLW